MRSIASSATRQFYTFPNRPNFELVGRGVNSLDFFAGEIDMHSDVDNLHSYSSVHFNEDLTAFHGPTLAAQIAYTSAALRYISSLYPANTKIIIMGHSMGGVVGVSQLPSHLVSAIFTMSTPYTVPPARFDKSLEQIYSNLQEVLESAEVPILSICGGVTDLQIPSEFCNLPNVQNRDGGAGNNTAGLRKTVYSSALEGCWTGVGHNEMVWCHQVRWRVARAAMEIGAITAQQGTDDASKGAAKERVLEEWFRDGLQFDTATKHEGGTLVLQDTSNVNQILKESELLDIRKPVGENVYLLPIPRDMVAGSGKYQRNNFVLFLSQGSIKPISPAHPLRLSASVHICSNPNSSTSPSTACTILQPTSLRLIPNPAIDRQFPLPHEGVDESEGVVVFEGNVPSMRDEGWVAVWVRDGSGDERGWVRGGFEKEGVVEVKVGKYGR